MLVHADEDKVFWWDAAQPFTNVAGVEFAFGIVMLFLESGWLVQDDFSL